MSKVKKPSRYVPEHLRQRVFQRDGYKCLLCGDGNIDYLEIDHKHPVSKGGLSTFDNLQTLCGKCNSLKRDKTPQCPKCDKFVVAGKLFCPSCGQKVGTQNFLSTLTTVKAGSRSTWVRKSIAIVILIWCAIAFNRYVNNSTKPTFSSSSIPVAQVPVPAKNSTKIVNETFEIQPESYYDLPFTVPQATNGHISGGFRVTKGVRVSCWVLDEEEYQSWTNNGEVKGLFQSGESMAAKIRRKLEPGKYYLIFENTSADKLTTVAAQVNVEF